MDRWTYDIIKLGDLKLISLYYWDFAAIDFNSNDIDKLIRVLQEIKGRIQKKGN